MEVMGERATPGYRSRPVGSSIGDAGSGRLCPTTRLKPVMKPESSGDQGMKPCCNQFHCLSGIHVSLITVYDNF